MRRLALVGLVVSLVLAAVAVFEASENVHARQGVQDRALQSAVNNEITLISGGERQTTTALSLMLVNPAVRQLLSDRALPATARGGDLADTAETLATIERSSFVPLSAACLDDGQGRQLVCAPTRRRAAFPLSLTRQFVALADSSPVGATSGTFLSPFSGQLSVAFLAPFRVHGRTLGVVHLDISLAATRGSSSLLVNDTPGVNIQLGSYERGLISLDGPSNVLAAAGLGSPRTLRIAGGALGQHPQPTLDGGHRAIAAVLPLTIGGHQHIAVAATAAAPNPNLLNAWGPGLLTVLAIAIVTLLGSLAGLAVANRRVVRELSTDPLTGLRNRRALLDELPRVCQRASEREPAYLWFFDLNGFKTYNDSFGHIAGDTLLARLGERLRELIAGHGWAYRLGGDEFCALITGGVADPHALLQRARHALSEQGGAFTVDSAAGAVEIPREASEPTQALRLADQHMYREKATSRGGAAELITCVLHAALAQRHPDLGEHSDDVAGDVELLARTIGLEEEMIALVVKAGDLHDVGKLGIPDEIITKPGALSEQEWEFMRQHTVMGEKIIAAAGPSLERIGPLVRASHERWDGNGYPDGLAGEQIPLGARIITICDSFRAMLDERSYKRAMSLQDALAELRRCAGTQFDPNLVEVFCRLVSERVERAAAGAQPKAAPARAGRRARAARRPATVPQ
ncbi:MAG TPA: diguanylate cyclase [Solirubrobacteraceae bacterium]|nr:diguanylate cyclase [Solirubrobacteraceae bacterium]